MKRFTDTVKWDDPWFRKLSPKHKCLWLYLCDKCDSAGVIDFDPDLAAVHIGDKVRTSDLEAMSGRLFRMENGKYVISQFISFQYGKLSEACPAHKPVLKATLLHGFLKPDKSLCIPSARVFNTLQEKEKDKETDKEEGDARGNHETVPLKRADLPTSPAAVRICDLFHRRLSTPWDEKEIAAFKKCQPTVEEIGIIEPYYAAERGKGDDGIHRRDLATFLNNYRGEVDRATSWKASNNGNGTKPRIERPTSIPEGFQEWLDRTYPDKAGTRAETLNQGLLVSLISEFRKVKA